MEACLRSIVTVLVHGYGRLSGVATSRRRAPHRSRHTASALLVALLLSAGCSSALHPPTRLSFSGAAQAAALDHASASATVAFVDVTSTPETGMDALTFLYGGEGSLFGVVGDRYRLGLSVSPALTGPEGLLRVIDIGETTVDLIHGFGLGRHGQKTPVTFLNLHGGLLFQTRHANNVRVFLGLRAMWGKDVSLDGDAMDEGTRWLGAGLGASTTFDSVVWSLEIGAHWADGPTVISDDSDVGDNPNDYRVFMLALTLGLP